MTKVIVMPNNANTHVYCDPCRYWLVVILDRCFVQRGELRVSFGCYALNIKENSTNLSLFVLRFCAVISIYISLSFMRYLLSNPTF